MLASKKFSSSRIMLIILKCLKAVFIYSNTEVTSSPEICALVSHGAAIKQSHKERRLLRFHLQRLLSGADTEGGKSGVKIATAIANFKTEMHKLFPNLLERLNPEASKSYFKKLM